MRVFTPGAEAFLTSPQSAPGNFIDGNCKVKLESKLQTISWTTVMMNLMHWRLLLAVADTGNISKAAEGSGITQSGASQAIAQLEEALGAPLFVREHRRTIPTALGFKVIERARAMLAELETIQSLSDDSKAVSAGRIKVASFPSTFTRLFPDLLRGFRRLHPTIAVVALEGSDDEVESWIAANIVDVGVVLNPAPGRNALSLGHDAWVAVVPSAHSMGRRSTDFKVALADLVRESFILATGGCRVNPLSLVQKAGLAFTDVRVTVRDWDSAFLLVREGMGVALVPESTLPLETPGIRVFHLESPIVRDFGLVCSGIGTHSRAVKVFLDFVENKVRDAQPKVSSPANESLAGSH